MDERGEVELDVAVWQGSIRGSGRSGHRRGGAKEVRGQRYRRGAGQRGVCHADRDSSGASGGRIGQGDTRVEGLEQGSSSKRARLKVNKALAVNDSNRERGRDCESFSLREGVDALYCRARHRR